MSITITLAFLIGLFCGFFVAFLLKKKQETSLESLVQSLHQNSETQRQQQLDLILEKLKSSFGELSAEKLSQTSQELQNASQNIFETQKQVHTKELDSKKELIDQQLHGLHHTLQNFDRLLKELEKDRENKYGELSSQLKFTNQQTSQLIHTTQTLKDVLSHSRLRGQWGERMAEDVLRTAGFIENINYQKQKSIESIGSRPDFTFSLPRDLKLNMDVKFPMDNYLRFLEATTDVEKNKYRQDFFKDVKAKIKEITTRDYINPEQNTVDYVLLFIPNEQIYSFIHENDHTLLDESLKKHVVLCSPITLFAILAVIRQAIENFSLERTAHEILALFGTFQKQWDLYSKKFEDLGKRLQDAQKEYDTLVTTRKRQLEKPLQKIEELRQTNNIAAFIDDSKNQSDESQSN